MKPSNKTWSLTVRAGSLYLDGPHSSTAVRGIAPEVVPVVRALPDGTTVECEGSFDGGTTILHLHVTRVIRIHKDLSGRVMELPDAVVAADPRLATARARIHFDAGRNAEAAKDVRALLDLGDDHAIAEYERLPEEHRPALESSLVAWQAKRPAAWRALRHIPIAQWTEAHLERAIEDSLASGGVFGTAPGIRAEALVEELTRRKVPAKGFEKQTQRLRRAQATEGDTFYRVMTDLETPRVIGADADGVFIAGTAKGANCVALYALDGRELRRWSDFFADRIVGGVALRIEANEPAGVRLADGLTLFSFAHRIQRHDGELVWGIHRRDPATKQMHSEIRHIATGYVIADLDEWVDDIAWNAEHIFIYGHSPKTLTREGRDVRAGAPPLPDTIEIEAASRYTLPAAHAPWLFGHWQSRDAGGWIVHGHGKDLYIAPSDPGATWVHLELAKGPAHVDLAPPWLAIHGDTGPILLVALAEAMSAQEIRVDGKRFAKRARREHKLSVSQAFIDWHTALVDAGIVPRTSEALRDARLHRVFAGERHPLAPALARFLVGHSPACVEHSDLFLDDSDDFLARLTAILSRDGVNVVEVARELVGEVDDDEPDDGGTEVQLTLQVTRDGKSLERPCGWGITNVVAAIDAMLAQLGAQLRIFALASDATDRRAYLVITPEQRRTLVAAGVLGIYAGPR